MGRFVALLRGINVGGRGTLAMADLRAAAESLGWTDVATYVQSGNVVFTAEEPSAEALSAALPQRPPVVILSRDELAEVVAANPFPDEENPKFLHAVFGGSLDPDAITGAKATDGEARIVGRTLYLHTPGGIGRNKFAAELARKGGDGTARNWSTVTKLLALLDG